MTVAVRIVVDIGNTRIKWGLLDAAGGIATHASWQARQDDPGWGKTRDEWVGAASAEWAVSSVNPSAADTFGRWLESTGAQARWYRSAAAVPLAMRVREPARAGADRALAVLAARGLAAPGLAGLVVSCGTALTIERIDARGVWEGGAIAAGLDAVSGAMQRSTAQLPRIEAGGEVPGWGDETESAMRAGAFWGTVGALRELIARQGDRPWRIWTGGHAVLLAPLVEPQGTEPWVVPDLVLRGLAMAAFGATAEAIPHG